MITISVNGKQEQLPPSGTLELLLSNLELRQDRVAVELNGEIISSQRYAQQTLQDGDEIEIVTFVGGG
jgi:sulfur carrier protein